MQSPQTCIAEERYDSVPGHQVSQPCSDVHPLRSQQGGNQLLQQEVGAKPSEDGVVERIASVRSAPQGRELLKVEIALSRFLELTCEAIVVTDLHL